MELLRYAGEVVLIQLKKFRMVMIVRKISQNQRTMKNFSLKRFIGKAHWTLCLWMLSPRFLILKSQKVILKYDLLK